MKKRVYACFAALAAVIVGASGCSAVGYTVYRPTFAFSDDILFSARMLGGRVDYAYERMCEIISDVDGAVSLTRADSDLSRLNAAAAGERVEVSEYAYELFCLSRDYYELTDGAFNCAASPLGELWHTDAASLAEMERKADGERVYGSLPTAEEVASTLAYCNPESVAAEETDGKRYLTKSDARTALDFGGIAKGYAIDKCVEVLDEYGVSSALLDIAGNLYAYGDYALNTDGLWNIGITAPRPRVAPTRGLLCALSLSGGESAVTSGDYMRYYVCESGDAPVYVTHITGRDGEPIGVVADGDGWKNGEGFVVSATVLGESSAMCDALSTAVCVLGYEDGAALLQKVGYKGLIFTEKRYTIIGNVPLYKPDEYDGHKAYEYEP